ncbi:MAG: YggS family pyridoxal phosphate-dependent enzyme [Clostridia bacterium]|nr:YggS family pyridoxal phosphate-dependent enzyme [Clostridia bacterium]
MDTQKVKCGFKEIVGQVNEAERAAGRRTGEVRIIGATKFKTAEEILPVIREGLLEAGENRAGEFVEKYDFFIENGVKPHFIGALQTNKAKYLVGRAELIQSVDRLPLAEEINRLAVKRGVVQNILVEVNIGSEEQKSGVLPDELIGFLKVVSAMPGIGVKGLMCIPPMGNETQTRPYFAAMKELFESVKRENIPNIEMKELSMGMSGDYKAAILEGATMVRIGSALFGPRTAAAAAADR